MYKHLNVATTLTKHSEGGAWIFDCSVPVGTGEHAIQVDGSSTIVNRSRLRLSNRTTIKMPVSLSSTSTTSKLKAFSYKYLC